MLFALRTMGELAHPNTDYAFHRKALRKCAGIHQKAQYFIDNKFSSAALIGTITDDEGRNARLAAFTQANGRLLYNPLNADRTGRDIGAGLQPQINYDCITEAVISNSDTLTPRDLAIATAKANAEVSCGAWLYSPFQPRRTSTGLGIAGHVDAFFAPDDGSPKWWMTSLISPTLTENEVVLDRMKKAGFTEFHPSPPRTLLEQLYADSPPNSLIGSWNIVLAGTLDEEGKNLTMARLGAAQAGKPNDVLYETMFITKIWLSIHQYRQARILFELQALSKSKSQAYPLSIGSHSGINSCAQFTGAIFDATGKIRCLNLQDVYFDAINGAVQCWATDVHGKEIFDFLEGGDDDFRKVTKCTAKKLFDEYLSQASLFVSNRPDRAAYAENYLTCTDPHPDADGAAFYELAADVALDLLMEQTEPN